MKNVDNLHIIYKKKRGSVYYKNGSKSTKITKFSIKKVFNSLFFLNDEDMFKKFVKESLKKKNSEFHIMILYDSDKRYRIRILNGNENVISTDKIYIYKNSILGKKFDILETFFEIFHSQLFIK